MKLRTKGFTLIELLIASSIFSVILLLCSVGLVRIGQVYYKGVGSSRTQSALRAISDDVTQAVQYSGKSVGTKVGTYPKYQQCVGNRRYTYEIGNKTGRVLVVEAFSSNCTVVVGDISDILDPLQDLPTGARELMPAGMRLLQFKVGDDTVLANGQNQVDIRVGLGDIDLFASLGADVIWSDEANVARAICKGGAGQQFCATAQINTKVRRRVVL